MISGTTGYMTIPPRIHTVKLENCNECPKFSEGLRNLDIQNCTFTTLSQLPSTLEVLWIENTPITSLPQLPDGLTSLYILKTPLTEAPPEIPSTVKNVYIGNYAKEEVDETEGCDCGACAEE
jgi:Leucine-rich repeat (LRR) protein